MCDAYALDRIMELKQEAFLNGEVGDLCSFSTAQPLMLLLLNYIARSSVDGSPAADKVFDDMINAAETWLAEHHEGGIRGRRSYAALLVALELGGLVMRAQLSRALGSDILEPEGHLRLLHAKIDFYSQAALSGAMAQEAHATLDQIQRRAAPR